MSETRRKCAPELRASDVRTVDGGICVRCLWAPSVVWLCLVLCFWDAFVAKLFRFLWRIRLRQAFSAPDFWRGCLLWSGVVWSVWGVEC